MVSYHPIFEKHADSVYFHKEHPGAVIPKQMTSGSAGIDISAISFELDYFTETIMLETGLSMRMPIGFWGLLCLRSSMYKKINIIPANGIGVIDNDYRGEIKFPIKSLTGDIFDCIPDEVLDNFNGDPVHKNILRRNWTGGKFFFKEPFRFGQIVLMPMKQVNVEESEKPFEKTKRGKGGFGSTGE